MTNFKKKKSVNFQPRVFKKLSFLFLATGNEASLRWGIFRSKFLANATFRLSWHRQLLLTIVVYGHALQNKRLDNIRPWWRVSLTFRVTKVGAKFVATTLINRESFEFGWLQKKQTTFSRTSQATEFPNHRVKSNEFKTWKTSKGFRPSQ